MHVVTYCKSATIRRAVAGDAERLTALIQGSTAYQGAYASIIEGYRVAADYIDATRCSLPSTRLSGCWVSMP